MTLLASQLTPEQEQQAVFDALAYALVLIFVVAVAAAAVMAAWDWWLTPPCDHVVLVPGGGGLCERRAGHAGPHRHDIWTDTTPAS